MKNFFDESAQMQSPLRALFDFLKIEKQMTDSRQTEKMRFVGYVLELGYDMARLVTSDPYKQAVGGVPRGSFLILAADNLENVPPHFSLLRVTDTAPTPLSKEVQQTYFELHKKSMPELDKFTISELQWGALNAKVLGMYFPKPDDIDSIMFSGDVNSVVSAHRYKVYAPDPKLLDIIVNGIVRSENKFSIGKLRLTECLLPFANVPQPDLDVQVSTNDFRGFRTAMFGKTRLGKSNVVKIIAQSILETTKEDKSVGQLIFDVNGEYANDNPQDGNSSIRSAYQDRCQVYALNPRSDTPSKPLKLNFYENPHDCLPVLKSLLAQDGRGSIYVTSFSSVELPSIDDIKNLPQGKRDRAARKIQIYWAILHKAGYEANMDKLKSILRGTNAKGFDPHFNKQLRDAAYSHSDIEVPSAPVSLDDLLRELIVIGKFAIENDGNEHEALRSSSSGNNIFDSEDMALLRFLVPEGRGAGASMLSTYKDKHSKDAADFKSEIVSLLDDGKTVILDLGSATDETRRYFSDMLSKEVFQHQEKKFVSNSLNGHFVQLYFEEAHNLFPKNDNDFTGVYARFAKEGAKFHIGMVYSTQSPSTINKELLAQTENFFVGHMSSQDETNVLAKLQVQFDGLQQDILHSRTPGYMRMLTFSHRFVIPVQINKFEADAGQ